MLPPVTYTLQLEIDYVIYVLCIVLVWPSYESYTLHKYFNSIYLLEFGLWFCVILKKIMVPYSLKLGEEGRCSCLLSSDLPV